MAGISRIFELANKIQADVVQIQSYLPSADTVFPPIDTRSADLNLTEELEGLRAAVKNNASELHNLVLTPRETLLPLSLADFVSLHVIYRFRISQCIPIGQKRTYTQISDVTGLSEKLLRRVLRQAMTARIFCEPSSGVVAHTAASQLLAENVNIHDYVGTICEEVWPASSKESRSPSRQRGHLCIADALQKWPGSDDPKHTGFAIANGKEQTMFEMFEENPTRAARYSSSMEAFKSHGDYNVDHLINNYDWAALGNATVVDVGGGHGHIARALTKQFPSLNFVVEDLASVINSTRLIPKEEGDDDRVKYMVHDFLTEQPVKGADVYFFRKVLHDWPDDKAVKILQNLRPALKRGARVLIQDIYEPGPNAVSRAKERASRSTDMLILAIANGGQRDAEEWQNLFLQAGPGFKLQSAKLLPGTDNALIETVWEG